MLAATALTLAIRRLFFLPVLAQLRIARRRRARADGSSRALDHSRDRCARTFPSVSGWTLPNVVGVGGVQALLKAGMSVRGKRVVIAGSGPLLLPVAASLSKAGARLGIVAEQAPFASLARYAASLWRSPALLAQAAQLRASFLGDSVCDGNVGDARRGRRARRARDPHRRRARARTHDCDLLCVAFGLTPNTELARLLGCEIRRGSVVVDDAQTTSVPDVFCAGEPTGIGGVDLALVEGEIAGASQRQRECHGRATVRVAIGCGRTRRGSTRRLRCATSCGRWRRAKRSFVAAKTCGSASSSRRGRSRQAKLYTRAGMGACQGRICGAALEFVFGWSSDSVRPPIHPARVSSLIAAAPTWFGRTITFGSFVTMQQRDWRGVFPAITTPFLETMAIDHARLAKHVAWLVDNGCAASSRSARSARRRR